MEKKVRNIMNMIFPLDSILFPFMPIMILAYYRKANETKKAISMAH